jgi:hypothetical protein
MLRKNEEGLFFLFFIDVYKKLLASSDLYGPFFFTKKCRLLPFLENKSILDIRLNPKLKQSLILINRENISCAKEINQ